MAAITVLSKRKPIWYVSLAFGVLGIYFLLHNLGWLDWLRADIFWPIVLIALGAWLILRRSWR